MDDETLEAELLALPDKVKIDICIMVDGSEDLSCFESDERSLGAAHRDLLFKKLRRTKLFKKVKKAASKVASTVRKAASAVGKTVKAVVKAIADLSVTLDKTITFLDIDKTAKLTCENAGEVGAISYDTLFEVGVQFVLSAKARFKVKVSVKNGLDNALFSLFGGFGALGYVQLGATAAAEFAPDAITLFKKSKTKTFMAGPVPIVITNRPQLQAYVEASAAVEAEALFSAQIGWDYEITFEYDGTKSGDDRFSKTTSFTKRDTFPEDPEFSLRLLAEADLGLQFSWDIILYGTVQGTIAADVGLNGALEVGTNLEAIIVTDPYFYTLDVFEIDAYLEVRIKLGINNAITDVIKTLEGVLSEPTPTCTFSVEGRGFEVPTLSGGGVSFDSTPEVDTVVGILEDPSYQNVADLTLDYLMNQGALSDEFADTLSQVVEVLGILANLELEFTIYEHTWSLLGLPEIEIELESSSTCVDDSAIVLNFVSNGGDDVLDGMWFGNFDGTVLSEETDWLISSNNDPSAVTLTLPRSSSNGYTIQEGMELILRSTPEVLPWPKKSLYSKIVVDGLEGLANLESFDCCDDTDCQSKFGSGYACNSNMCESSVAWPDCGDALPTDVQLSTHVGSASEAYEYCRYECSNSEETCTNWQNNYPQ